MTQNIYPINPIYDFLSKCSSNFQSNPTTPTYLTYFFIRIIGIYANHM